MKNIIVREYLESLKEDKELDAIFPLLLEAMDFQIITAPKETKGFQQYGKDIVAVGIDEDGVKKRFYFESKGGDDKNVTPGTFTKDDGIRMSLIEAKDRPFEHNSVPDFKDLPVKIVLVHNGVLKENVREVFEGFITREFAPGSGFEFERWDIHKLTELFVSRLFNEYLLTDDVAVQHFKKVLLLFGTPTNDNRDFKILIDRIFAHAGVYSDLSIRGRIMLGETLKLISFIVHSYADEAGNLEPARICLDYTAISYWKWILQNGKEKDKEALKIFRRYLETYRRFQTSYFEKTLPVAQLPFGMWSPQGGRYEQAGYPMRSLEYIGALVNYFNMINTMPSKGDITKQEQLNILANVIENNDATHRPLLDNHSIPIALTLDFLIRHGQAENARQYLKNVLGSVMKGYQVFRRLPDGANSIQNVIRFMVTGEKSVYYADTTSNLLAMLLEYVAVLDLHDEYINFIGFLKETGIYLGLFVPYGDEVLQQLTDIDADNHELALLDHTLEREGYQSEVNYYPDFDTFKSRLAAKNEFNYEYRTAAAGFGFLLGTAHHHFKTPLFPDTWRPATQPPHD